MSCCFCREILIGLWSMDEGVEVHSTLISTEGSLDTAALILMTGSRGGSTLCDHRPGMNGSVSLDTQFTHILGCVGPLVNLEILCPKRFCSTGTPRIHWFHTFSYPN